MIRRALLTLAPADTGVIELRHFLGLSYEEMPAELGTSLSSVKSRLFRVRLGVILLGIHLIALLLVVAAVWPGFTLQARNNLEGSPGKSILVGLVKCVFLSAITLLTLNLGAVAVVGLGLGACFC